jgi:predicted HTH transcriptional regulator
LWFFCHVETTQLVFLHQKDYRKIEKAYKGISRNKQPTNAHVTAKTRKELSKMKLNKTDELVMVALKEGKELTLQEIAEKTGESSKKIFKSLRKLFENELISTNARKYKLTSK